MTSRRLTAAEVVPLLGVSFCFVMYWWQLRYEHSAHGLGLNLFMAFPFLGLEAMVLGGMTRVATVAGRLVLAAMTGAAYVRVAANSSSTAPVLYIAPFFYGAIVLSPLFAVDSIVRARRERRHQ